jgi:osmotically-inducible protein OsmY
MRTIRIALVTATFAGALWGLSRDFLAAAQPTASGAATQAANTQESDAAACLDKTHLRDVKVSVDQGVATLTGSVELYGYKADAGKRVRKAKGITSVRNLIEVAGPAIADQQLQDKLREKLAYDRVFYGNAFNAITVEVENGAVTLGGHALSYFSRDSALALVNYYPGVKDVVDQMQVDPVSTMDFPIRFQLYRAIYGFPTLNKYAIDPAKPIRISVQNGHVELYGMVDSQSDKDMAFIRANGVPGVFDVKNYLQVAGQPATRQE